MKYILLLLSTYCVFIAFGIAVIEHSMFSVLLSLGLLFLNLSMLEEYKKEKKK